MPLFLLRRPLLTQAERVWWGVSGSISLRTEREGGRGGREEGGRQSPPPAQAPLAFIYIFFIFGHC